MSPNPYSLRMGMVRTIHLQTDFGERLHFLSLHGEESLGKPYAYRVTARWQGELADTEALLGKSAVVTIKAGDAAARYIHGMVSCVEILKTRVDGGQAAHHVQLTLVPRLWLLGQHRDCRIFSELSLPEIVQTVLESIGFSDVRMQLEGDYPRREYCVQYEESTLDFISRLMEQEGMYYFFEHAEDRHTLVLADGLTAHRPAGNAEKLICRNDLDDIYLPWNGVCSWHARQALRPRRWEQGGFDPYQPRANLHAEARVERSIDIDGLSVYSAEGRHVSAEGGRRLAQAAVRAQACETLQWRGDSGSPLLAVGVLLNINEASWADGNGDFLLVSTDLKITQADLESTSAPDGIPALCTLTALPSNVAYRQPQRTPWPRIAGLQSAIVAGEREDDIAVDEHGRVRVTFHWSSAGRKHGHVSCPVRVATPWAGKGWGMQSLPRVGQEVLVAFLDGDPDRPLIVGSVFNGDHQAPFALPDNRTQSGIRSRSHPDGGTDEYNEIRFEDRKGAEELRLHAERDLHVEAENDRTLVVGNDQTASVGNDQALTVEHDQKVTVRNERMLEVGANARTRIGQRFRLEAGEQIELVTGASRIVMTSAGDITIEGVNVRIAGNSSVDIEGGVEVKVKAGAMMDIGAGASLKMHSDASLQVQAGAMAEVKAPVLTLSGDALAKMAAALITIG